LGSPFPSVTYHPLTDEGIPPEDRALAFARWVSGYFTHGDTEETLERRTPDTDRPATILTLNQDEVQAFFAPGPAGPDGSDHAILLPGFSSGAERAHVREDRLPGLSRRRERCGVGVRAATVRVVRPVAVRDAVGDAVSAKVPRTGPGQWEADAGGDYYLSRRGESLRKWT
jgi:hypothetical protein